MKCWSLAAWPAVKVLPLVGMVSLMLPLAALAQTPPTFTPQQQAFLDELKGRVSSRLYQSRIRNQPDTYVLVGEGACQEMREQGYAAVIGASCNCRWGARLWKLPANTFAPMLQNGVKRMSEKSRTSRKRPLNPP
jgi:hypothetical protein